MKKAFKTAGTGLFILFFAFLSSAVLNSAANNFCLAATAGAGVKTFVILPFSVNGPSNYKYLEQSIPTMFTSRLDWRGHVEVSPNQEKLAKTVPPGEAEVKKAMLNAGADYAVWGALTILGQEYSLDVYVMDSQGNKWPKSQQSKIDLLIPSLSGVCDGINNEVFKRPSSGAVAVAANTPSVQPSGSASGAAPRSINPSIQYSGGSSRDENRLRSQLFNYTASGMEVCDADGDGQNEVFIFDDYNLYAYVFQNSRLTPLHNIRVSLVYTNIAIRSFDFSNSGKKYVILTSMDKEQKPLSRIYNFDGKKLNLEMDGIPYFLNVVKDYSTGKDVLIGQPYDKYSMFRNNAVTMMIRNGKELVPGEKLNLPRGVNLYDFAFLPAGREVSNDTKIVNIGKLENMKVFTLAGSLLSASEEKYSCSSVGLDINSMLPGMGDDLEAMPSQYYLPIRMLPVDLNRDGDYELIVANGISSSAHIIQRYRQYLQSEILCMYWDGVGMSQQWKTRTLQGGIVDVALNDLDNNGKPDLIACLNVGDGFRSRKTMVVAYPLDLQNIESGEGEFVSGK
ncbi:MAG: hypothetical protein LBM00_00315 [Deltaproteobacteria bacterium]|jgi:hypothetical protein|nr:hypothetical protein [Deltaproteobacteria bacterium]